ncbi:N-acetylmuramoyl-L-alanine amidase family protein [Bianquea renquensis]|jgi:N-acetylmuramoyl-L-alanine amidase|uniref:N-acetylmuramoyl-L-alanine amidase n=1 Tax=Bianquea renquensis TaxID=2763661 RepID=A0A926I0H7_9FIRM|nr:N-acetylmuramoyl-L-alanine amidase [Bianquea renquensis]MBC8542210.1 N-acetylmuramoyl-L-alanine amidase [Bianquea renquensis]
MKKANKIWIAVLLFLLVVSAAAGGLWVASRRLPAEGDESEVRLFLADGMRYTPTERLEGTASGFAIPSTELSPLLEEAKRAVEEKMAEEQAKSRLEGLVIGIDPGHQNRGDSTKEPNAPGSAVMKAAVASGTTGRFTKVPEHQVTLAVGLLLRDMLEEAGATVVMTRETGNVNISNVQRALLFNEAEVDLAVRIHCDGAESSDVHGASMLVPAGDSVRGIEEASYKAGRIVMDSFVAITGAKNRGLSKRDDQTGFNWSTVPVITIEMGFMSNEQEDVKLVSEDYQRLCAQGLCEGIAQWYDQVR